MDENQRLASEFDELDVIIFWTMKKAKTIEEQKCIYKMEFKILKL